LRENKPLYVGEKMNNSRRPLSPPILSLLAPQYVAAASFWNYNTTADPSSTEFVNAIWALNDDLISRGA
jgi:hypothetical protein